MPLRLPGVGVGRPTELRSSLPSRSELLPARTAYRRLTRGPFDFPSLAQAAAGRRRSRLVAASCIRDKTDGDIDGIEADQQSTRDIFRYARQADLAWRNINRHHQRSRSQRRRTSKSKLYQNLGVLLYPTIAELLVKKNLLLALNCLSSFGLPTPSTTSNPIPAL
jgi:hypothetical protein